MNKRTVYAFTAASATHALVLFGISSYSEKDVEASTTETFDVMLEDIPKEIELEPTLEEELDPEEALLPEEFSAPGLAEPPPTALATEAITQLVRAEPLRPPRPDGMQTIGIPTSAQRKSGGQLAKSIFALEELDRPPRTRSEVMPQYPHELKRGHIEGSAILMMIVDTRGRVIKVDIESATDPLFGRSAYAAALKWRFEPGLKDGKPVSFRVRQPFNFNP